MVSSLCPAQRYFATLIIGAVWFIVIVAGTVFCGGASAVGIPSLAAISPEIAAARPELATQRAMLQSERAGLRASSATHNKACEAVEEGSAADNRCARELESLTEEADRHVEASRRFNERLLEAKGALIIRKMNALAKRLGWSEAEQSRLNLALNALDLGGDLPTAAQIKGVWEEMLNRSRNGEFARGAAMAGGAGLPGAGLQAAYQDCAVFALASATGLPYGVAAARAGELISQGEWRSAAERANPQKVIEAEGLNGGEVVMLAEAFGQVEVVGSADFARILQEGRAVLVNVVPEGGEGGHEVVLTKTFQHAGATWYEMLDSNQGPIKRLYLNVQELNAILQENGVAIRPDPGTTTKLLRTESAH